MDCLVNFLGRVGKTSLTVRYCMNEFDDDQGTTSNATFLEKNIKMDNGITTTLAIWVMWVYKNE